MAVFRTKGFQIFKDKRGKMRCYHRKTRTAIDLERAPLGSAEFMAECARIMALAEPAPKPGTLGGLIEKYRASPAFLDLAPRTRSDYQRVFDYLKPIRDTTLTRFTTPFLVKLRDKAAAKHKRRFANYVRQVPLQPFLVGQRARLHERQSGSRRAELAQAERDGGREQALERRGAARSPGRSTGTYASGAGRDDVHRAGAEGRSYPAAHVLSRGRNRHAGAPRRESRFFWPVIGALRDVLEAAPEHDAITLLANSNGLPWTVSGFRASWRPLRLRLEKEGKVQPGLTLYGLRHTVAVMLKEAGLDDRSIADALGQKTEAMARHYSKGADLRRKMTGVAEKLEAEVNSRRTKVVKPDGK